MGKIIGLLLVVLIILAIVSVVSRNDIKIMAKDNAKEAGNMEASKKDADTKEAIIENSGAKAAVEVQKAPAAADEKSLFDVILTNPGNNKIVAIKIVREFTGHDLKSARDLIESVPVVIKKGVLKKDSEAFMANMEANGGRAELKIKEAVIENSGSTGAVEVQKAPAAADEKSLFDVILVTPGNNKINAVKYIREFGGQDLKTAKIFVDFVPALIKKGVSKKEAEDFIKKIEANGGSVKLK